MLDFNLHEATVLEPFLRLEQRQCIRLYGLPVKSASFALLNERILLFSPCLPMPAVQGVGASAQLKKETILSRRYIEGLIAEGKHVFIFDDRVLKVDAWIRFHPGGDKAIQHMVGRDATDEVNACVYWDTCVVFWESHLLTVSLTADCTRMKPVSECCRSKLVVSRDHG